MKNHKIDSSLADRYTITAALPYTNGPVHIGHLAGVYVPADIYARYLRLNRKDVAFVCGSDEHGVPITLKAKKEEAVKAAKAKAAAEVKSTKAKGAATLERSRRSSTASK